MRNGVVWSSKLFSVSRQLSSPSVCGCVSSFLTYSFVGRSVGLDSPSVFLGLNQRRHLAAEDSLLEVCGISLSLSDELRSYACLVLFCPSSSLLTSLSVDVLARCSPLPELLSRLSVLYSLVQSVSFRSDTAQKPGKQWYFHWCVQRFRNVSVIFDLLAYLKTANLGTLL